MDEKIGGISLDDIMNAATSGIDQEDSDSTQNAVVPQPEPVVPQSESNSGAKEKLDWNIPIIGGGGRRQNVPIQEQPLPVSGVPESKNMQPEAVVPQPEPDSGAENQLDWNIPPIGSGQRQDPFAQQQTPPANYSGIGVIGGGIGMTGGIGGMGGQMPAKNAPVQNDSPQPDPTTPPTPVPVTPQPKIQMRDFKCSCCGSPLKIPKNSKGIVVCPYCKNESVIEGLVKNAEIADKENINSGISLDAETTVLHNIVVEALASSVNMPLDIFDKAVILKEERYCVPAYMYYCNGTTSYSYEAGNIREHKTAVDLGDRTRVEKEQYVEWTQMTGMASASATLIAPGNRELASIVQKLYASYSPNDLIDVEELEFPYDVETYSYNLPQSAAFNEYVRPVMEDLLLEKAEESLRGRRYRNLSAGGGSSIQKDEIIRLFLGVYRIVYDYNGTEYDIYVSGDGRYFVYDESPVDAARCSAREALLNKKNSIDSKGTINKLIIAGIVLCGILAIFTYGITLLGAGGLGYLLYKNKKSFNQSMSGVDQEIAAFDDERAQALRQFRESQRNLQGIYSIN